MINWLEMDVLEKAYILGMMILLFVLFLFTSTILVISEFLNKQWCIILLSHVAYVLETTVCAAFCPTNLRLGSRREFKIIQADSASDQTWIVGLVGKRKLFGKNIYYKREDFVKDFMSSRMLKKRHFILGGG